MRLPILAVLASLTCAQAATRTTVASNVPLLASSTASWSGGAVPVNGDTVVIASPLLIDANIPATGTAAACSINGANAQITWDGLPHTVACTGQWSMLLGCQSTATTGCATAFYIDTKTQVPSMASATGSATITSTALTATAITGTIRIGQLVYGIGIQPGTVVSNVAGSAVTLSLNTIAAVTGTVNFQSVITWSESGLTSGQGIYDSNTPSAPYTVFAQVWNALFLPGTSGATLNDGPQFGVNPGPNNWSFGNSIQNGGITFAANSVGGFNATNVSVINNSGNVWSETPSPTGTTTANGSSGSKTLTGLSSTYPAGGALHAGMMISSTHLPTAVAYCSASAGSTALAVSGVSTHWGGAGSIIGTVVIGQTLTAIGAPIGTTISSGSGASWIMSAPAATPILGPCLFTYTITAVALYPGTTIAVSGFPTGTMTGETITYTQWPHFTNLTWLGMTGAGVVVANALAGFTPVTTDGLAILSDSAGTLRPATFAGGAGLEMSNVLIHSYYSGTTAQRCAGMPSLTSGVGPVWNSAIDGCLQEMDAYNFNASGFNFFAQSSAQNAAAAQGLIFAQGNGNPFYSRGDVLVQDTSNNMAGYLGALILNSANGITATSPQPDIGNMTVVMVQEGAGNPFGLGFGENSGANNFAAQNVTVHDSIISGNWFGIYMGDAVTTCATDGTGGVGLYNNLLYDFGGPTNGYFIQSSPGCGTGHPNVTYGDLPTQNPGFTGTTRYPANSDTRWDLADASLGGTGSVSNLFNTVMYGRSSGLAPLYAASQIAPQLRAPFSPSAAAIKTAGSSNSIRGAGGYIGAMPPIGGVKLAGPIRIVGPIGVR